MAGTEPIAKPLDVTVRPARSDDIAAIRAVARASWHAAYGEIFSKRAIGAYLANAYGRRSLHLAMTRSDSTFLVATRRGRVVGLCHFGDRGNGPEVFQLYVDPRFWGRGVGRRLLSHAEMQFLVLGARGYFLTVHRKNIKGLLFYQHLGFTRARAGDRHDEWCLVKRLGDGVSLYPAK